MEHHHAAMNDRHAALARKLQQLKTKPAVRPNRSAQTAGGRGVGTTLGTRSSKRCLPLSRQAMTLRKTPQAACARQAQRHAVAQPFKKKSRVSGRTPSYFIAAAPASLFMTASKASMSATSMDSATRLEALGWTNVVMFWATCLSRPDVFEAARADHSPRRSVLENAAHPRRAYLRVVDKKTDAKALGRALKERPHVNGRPCARRQACTHRLGGTRSRHRLSTRRLATERLSLTEGGYVPAHPSRARAQRAHKRNQQRRPAWRKHPSASANETGSLYVTSSDTLRESREV
jgi:hypothetical protein